jgi:hypothetical protein
MKDRGEYRSGGARGRRGKQLLEDFQVKEGYWKIKKKKALDRNNGEIALEEAMGLK